MDLLLTHGYYLYEDPTERAVMRPYPPLGLLYLSSHLKAKGFDVAVFDATFRHPDAFETYVTRHRPPVVGIYANMMTRPEVLRQIRLCKAHGARVVVGGPDPANYAEEYLEHGADVVVIGEGEHTMEEVLPHLARYGPASMEPIHGIAYRADEHRVARTPPRPYLENLDAQPFPDRDAIDLHEYVRTWREHHGRGAVSLITARGCPYRCTWCSHAVYGYSHRRRSPGNVADEVAHIREAYQPDMLWYADDVFTIKPHWLLAYAAELKRRDLRLPFETISREDRLNEEVVRTLAEMGCFRLWIGSESGSQRILDAMQRRTNAERVREMVRLLQQHGIEAGMFIMLGYDGEELADIEATVEHLKAALPDHVLTTLSYPIKGTPYYEQVADRLIPLKAWDEGSDRDLTVAGRHSRRFYRHASRWMLHEVAWHKQRRSTARNYAKMAKAYLGARAGRLGMLVTRHEVEKATP
ncbi:MAG: radical SAM protein [Rhodothermales bacterium]